MSRVIVAGGGAAGMMAAIAAAENGHSVQILEQNEKLGKKIYITGKGRCNVTNACEADKLFENVVSNPKFLYSAFYEFTNEQTMRFIEDAGCLLKIERGERVFPVSDHASDVTAALERVLKKQGVRVRLHAKVQSLLWEDGRVLGVLLQKNQEKVLADAVIVATGGLSYPGTGSTGDGYLMAKQTGHTVTECRPSLVPFEIKETWCKDLQGLSLKNVRLTLLCDGKRIYEELGEMLFTHFGISGPLVLSASSFYGKCKKKDSVFVSIDLKPALSAEQLDKRILRDFEENLNRQFKNSLGKLFPAKIIPVMIKESGVDPEKKIHEVTKAERQALVRVTKNLQMQVSGLRGFAEAIITQGGVTVKEINPSTMESKLISGLYFAGEVLDLDALTGGFNLQIAWSTGYLAGRSVT